MISIVIPTKNRLELLRRALVSVCHQTVSPAEVIVVDDGSLLPVIREDIFCHFPPEINCILIRNDYSVGVGFARNLGIKKASGDWIAFLDDDDEFKLNKLEIICNEIKDNSNVDVFYHSAEINMINEDVVYFSKQKKINDNVFFRELLVSNNVGGTSMVLVKKAVLEEVGLFEESLPALEDYELWLRIAYNAKKFKLINKPLTKYNYLTQQKSVSKNIENNNIAIELIREKYKITSILTNDELSRHYSSVKKSDVHRYLLNGQLMMAAKKQFDLFLYKPSFTRFVILISFIFGGKNFFKIRSMIDGYSANDSM